jgi:hypothetical protein
MATRGGTPLYMAAKPCPLRDASLFMIHFYHLFYGFGQIYVDNTLGCSIQFQTNDYFYTVFLISYGSIA